MKQKPHEFDRQDAPNSKAPAATPAAQSEGQSPVGRRLGALFVAHGLITEEQLGRALAEQRRTKEKVGAILVRLGFINEEQLVHFLSRHYGIPAVTLPESIDPKILKLVPAQIALKYDVIPLQRAGSSLTLAMADPTNLSAVDDVAFLTGLQVIPAIARWSAIRRSIEQHYETAPTTLADVLTEVEAESSEIEVLDSREASAVDLVELKGSADLAPVVRLVNMMLLDAIRREASDIHMEPYEKEFRIRFRIDGMLHEVMTPPKRLEPAIVSRIKIMANLDIAERRLPQDGRIKLRFSSTRETDFRVSIVPTIFGESVSLRLLDKSALKLDLAQLGFDPRGLEQFQKAIHAPYGMVLLTGPTGAGKTTTLYSALHTLNSPDINIMTVEDPVEYNLRGINQLQVNEEIGRTFAAALRSFLRHDPDAILVGEVRDSETAQIAVRAALTGHLVFSTLHTNDAPSTIARLIDMGVPPFLVASALLLVVAQRLPRRICLECKEPYEADEESLIPYIHTPLGPGPRTFFRGKGCPTCNFTGMKGRAAIYEVMPITPEIRDLILRNAPTGEIRELARQQGMQTLREGGLMKVIEGVTTVEEVVRVTAE